MSPGESTNAKTGAAPEAAPVSGVLGTHHGAYVFGLLFGAGALTALFFGKLLLSIGSILVLVVVAMFLAAGLNPAVEWFIRRGLTRAWSVFVVILTVLITIVLFVVALVPVITDQVAAIADNVPQWFDDLQRNQSIRDLDAEWQILDKIKDFVTSGDFTSAVFGGVVGFGLAILSLLTSSFLVFVLTLYFVSGLAPIKAAMWNLAPASKRPRVAELGDRVFDNVGHYVSGAFLVAMCAGVTSLVFLLIAGLAEYAVALAALVTVLDVIPMIGATIGAVIVTAIGFATDVKIGIACLIFYVIYQQVENYIVYPRVMQRSFDLPGWAIVIAALVGASLLGVVGALLAIPTAAAFSMILKEVWLPRQQLR
ncbi:MAG TPA: AI-2E family transporter [Nocardioidaceae bacterium]|nr:AI-2E family transporter [Nocardioidaceae bacterium]